MSLLGIFGPPRVSHLKIAKNVHGLIKALVYQKDGRVRQAAAEALGEIRDGRAVEPLIARLKDQDKEVRQAAAEALGKIRDGRAVEPLIARLKDQDKEVRRAAARALRWVAALQDRVVLPLVATLKDQDKKVRQAAAEALGQIANPYAVKHTIEPLITALKDQDKEVRQAAAESLREIANPYGVEHAIEPLITVLKDQDKEVRQAATRALGQIANPYAVKHTIEPLITALKDQETCESAITALTQIGKPAIEPLITALKDQETCEPAITALTQIGKPAIEPLITALKDQETCEPAADTLANLSCREYLAEQIRKNKSAHHTNKLDSKDYKKLLVLVSQIILKTYNITNIFDVLGQVIRIQYDPGESHWETVGGHYATTTYEVWRRSGHDDNRGGPDYEEVEEWVKDRTEVVDKPSLLTISCDFAKLEEIILSSV